jgi:hypothetical protein
MAQAIRCRWVLEKREEIQAAENPDFREISDQEDDPPAESDPSIPYDQMDTFADDIFDHNKPFDEDPSSAPNPRPINQHARVDDAQDEADPEFMTVIVGHVLKTNLIRSTYISLNFLVQEKYFKWMAKFMMHIQEQ